MWVKEHTNWEYDVVLDDGSANRHRGKFTALVFLMPYSSDDKELQIMIGNVQMTVVVLEHDPHNWYLIPNDPDDDHRQEDIGPFESVQDVITYASLLFA